MNPKGAATARAAIGLVASEVPEQGQIGDRAGREQLTETVARVVPRGNGRRRPCRDDETQ